MAFNKGWHLVYSPKSCGTDETVRMLSDLMNECDDLPTITMIEGLIGHIEGDV